MKKSTKTIALYLPYQGWKPRHEDVSPAGYLERAAWRDLITKFRTTRGAVLELVTTSRGSLWADNKGSYYPALSGSNDALLEGLPMDSQGCLIGGVLFLEWEDVAEPTEDCTCQERSWYGSVHDSACPLAGKPAYVQVPVEDEAI